MAIQQRVNVINLDDINDIDVTLMRNLFNYVANVDRLISTKLKFIRRPYFVLIMFICVRSNELYICQGEIWPEQGGIKYKFLSFDARIPITFKSNQDDCLPGNAYWILEIAYYRSLDYANNSKRVLDVINII